MTLLIMHVFDANTFLRGADKKHDTKLHQEWKMEVFHTLSLSESISGHAFYTLKLFNWIHHIISCVLTFPAHSACFQTAIPYGTPSG